MHDSMNQEEIVATIKTLTGFVRRKFVSVYVPVGSDSDGIANQIADRLGGEVVDFTSADTQPEDMIAVASGGPKTLVVAYKPENRPPLMAAFLQIMIDHCFGPTKVEVDPKTVVVFVQQNDKGRQLPSPIVNRSTVLYTEDFA